MDPMRLLRGARGENIGHSEIFANNLIFFSAAMKIKFKNLAESY